MVQWLGLQAFTAEGPGSIPGQGTKIPQATRHGQERKKERRYRNTDKQKIRVTLYSYHPEIPIANTLNWSFLSFLRAQHGAQHRTELPWLLRNEPK